jgi:hypothetical protein
MEGEPEQRQYYCAMCKSRLDYHKHLQYWLCPECFQQYDPSIQDVPLKNIIDSGVKIYPELQHNPTLDEFHCVKPGKYEFRIIDYSNAARIFGYVRSVFVCPSA